MSTTPDVAQALRAARELIAAPERWTQQAQARDADGQRVPAQSNAACCWCVAGAVEHVCHLRPVIWSAAISALIAALPRGYPHDAPSIGLYNDSRTHRTAIRWLDRAIAAAAPGGEGSRL